MADNSEDKVKMKNLGDIDHENQDQENIDEENQDHKEQDYQDPYLDENHPEESEYGAYGGQQQQTAIQGLILKPQFMQERDIYMYYKTIGENIGMTGTALHRFITHKVEQYEEKYRSDREEHRNHLKLNAEAEILEKQMRLVELQKSEKELDLEIERQRGKREREEEERKSKESSKLLKKQAKEEEKKRIYQLEKRKHEIQKEIEMKKHEKTLRKMEAKEKQKQREHELILKEKELETILQKHEEEIEKKNNENIGKKIIKMKIFKDDKDDIDDFLCFYEVQASENKVPREKWGTHLGAYLEGPALAIYHSLCKDNHVDYKTLKEELLFKFSSDAEGFHHKFRNRKPKSDESFRSYYTALCHLFNRWLRMLNIEETYEALYDFMICEQMIASCCEPLQIHLKERGLKKSEEIIKEANTYRAARSEKDVAKKGQIALSGNESVESANASLDSKRMVSSQYQPNGLARGYPGPRFQNPRGRGRGRGGFTPNFFTPGPTFRHQYGQNQDFFDNRCHLCKKEGHFKKDCPKRNEQGSAALPKLGSACSANVPTAEGKINGKRAIVMRDTGASVAGVRKSFIKQSQIQPEKISVQLFDGTHKEFETAKVLVESPFFNGEVTCCIIEAPPYDLILGNIDGSRTGDLILASTAVDSQEQIEIESTNTAQVGCVTTRNQSSKEKQETKPLKLPKTDTLGISKDELIILQEKDTSLDPHRKCAKNPALNNKEEHKYTFENGILCRIYTHKNKETSLQILVPNSLRLPLLQMAHECLLAGHGGRKRTTERLYSNFYWPGIHVDVREFCKSCDRCQKTSPRIPNIPLDFMPHIETPFDRIAVDITGPLSPPSDEGHRYILSVIDVATRYPEAVALKKIDTVTVAEEILRICTRMGFPKEILSDNGSQFTSEMMYEIYRLMNIEPVHCSPYHAQSNGIVERFHGTIKPMLRKLTENHPKNWNRYLPSLLYACRDVTNASTGFTPFELLFGRRPRGPLDLIADTWTGKADDSQKSTFQYICELREFFETTARMVEENVKEAAKTNKKYKDRHTKPRQFSQGDEVLLLLPDDSHKLLMGWKGPFKVIGKKENNYIIEIKGKQKVYHANLLKKYHRRAETEKKIDYEEILGHDFEIEESIACIASVFIADEDENDVQIHTLPSQKETIEDAKIDDKLNQKMEQEMKTILSKATKLYKLDPGTFIGNIQHEINLKTDQPIRKKQYPLPFASQETLRKEVEYMEEIGVIERSNSPYCSPIVLIGKPDGSTRVCVDYREINKQTVFDAEPIPDVEELFIQLANKKFFTKVDLSKGFWQIEVRDTDREKTAFQAPQGLFQFIKMPFGLVTAPATFARMMRHLELEKHSSMNFFDDILTASENWEQHLIDVRNMLECLEKHGLTVRPSKIYAGFQELEFLGHIVGEGRIKPEKKKVEKILNIPRPNTKKQIRSMMGLMGYYRRYIPGYSVITAPITDLLKGNRKPINWTTECEEALKQVQAILSKQPILILPILNREFTVQTDASNIGVAGVLLQQQEGKLHPVAYVSRKLLDRETRYSTIEKECLAIVWTLKKLDRYLWGQNFILQTDHKPLTFLNSAMFKNNRILGWSLAIQGYQFTVKEIAGKDNVLADILSRSGEDQSLP